MVAVDDVIYDRPNLQLSRGYHCYKIRNSVATIAKVENNACGIPPLLYQPPYILPHPHITVTSFLLSCIFDLSLFEKYLRNPAFTSNLYLMASLHRFELLTALDRFLVNCPSSKASYLRKRCRPTANLRKASPRTSSLSKEKRSQHLSVVSASRTWQMYMVSKHVITCPPWEVALRLNTQRETQTIICMRVPYTFSGNNCSFSKRLGQHILQFNGYKHVF